MIKASTSAPAKSTGRTSATKGRQVLVRQVLGRQVFCHPIVPIKSSAGKSSSPGRRGKAHGRTLRLA